MAIRAPDGANKDNYKWKIHLFLTVLGGIIRIILSGQPPVFPLDSSDIVLHCDILLLFYHYHAYDDDLI